MSEPAKPNAQPPDDSIMSDLPSLIRYVDFDPVESKEPWQKLWKLWLYKPKDTNPEHWTYLDQVATDICKDLPDKPKGYYWRIRAEVFYDASLLDYCYYASARCLPNYTLGV